MTFGGLGPFFVVKDEYGNYYEVLNVFKENDKLIEITLANFFYSKSNTRFFEDELVKRYDRKFIGHFLIDSLHHRIKLTIEKIGKIYTLSELKESGTRLIFADVTAYKCTTITRWY